MERVMQQLREKEDAHDGEYKPLVSPDVSDGGPSGYYNFPEGMRTLNDLMEFLAKNRWGATSLHFKDIVKAAFRFGSKKGTDEAYDIKKIVYSGLRLLIMTNGFGETEDFINHLSKDPQFQKRNK